MYQLKQYSSPLIIGWLLICLFASTLSAQQAERISDSGLLGKNIASIDNEGLLHLMRARIDHMADVLELDPQQVGKLRLAASAIIKNRKTPQELFPHMFGNSPKVDGDNKDTFSDNDAESSPDVKKSRFANIRMPIPVRTVIRDKMWIKTVATVFTDEQKEAWTAAEKERKNKIRDIVTEYRTWHLAQRLNLTDEQIAKVKNQVKRIESAWYTWSINFKKFEVLVPTTQRMAKQITAKNLKGILTPEQMEQFKAYSKDNTRLGEDAIASLMPTDADRLQKLRDAAVNFRVCHLAERLRIREAQLPAVRKVVDQVEGDWLVKASLQKLAVFTNGREGFVGVSKQDLADALDENQLQLLETYNNSSNRKINGGSSTK